MQISCSHKDKSYRKTKQIKKKIKVFISEM